MSVLSEDDPLRRDVEAVGRIEAVPTILRVVCESTGLGFAAVARVTTDQWVACAVHDKLSFGLFPGATLDVSTTLCATVRDQRATVVIDHASLDPLYCNHVTPKMYGFESYISVPIFLVDGSYFGTVCALDPQPNVVNTPRIITQLTLFAELIALQLDADKKNQATRLAKQRLESFVLGAPAAIAVLRGPELVFELVNPRYQALVGDRPLIGRSAFEALPEAAMAGKLGPLEEVFRTGRAHSEAGMRSIAPLVRGDSRGEIFVDWVAQPTRDEHGVVDGVLIYVSDVTDQLAARHALERKNRELDDFAYVVSHDLKTPLRGIGHLAHWLEEDLGRTLTGDARHHLDRLHRRVQHMNALIDGMLRFARAANTDADRVLSEVDVAELLADVIDLVSLPPEASITVGGPMPVFRAARVALQHVFLNLIANATKHAGRPDVRITVGVVEEPSHWVFSVADNGQGIPPMHHERVWKLFQSLAPKDDGNTGIGLAVVKKLVEARHGRVWIGETPGGGATFYFSWPKHEVRASSGS